MNKCKFKQHQHVVAVVNGDNVTQGDVYVVVTPYENTHDIPCVSVIGDNGNLAYNYQTVFREAKMPPCLEQAVVEEMSVDEARFIVEETLDDCNCPEGYLVSHVLIAKIQHDKELQKALLVLMQTANCLGEGK